jgi:threonylcarbamoyladenosine tRNA methylthiotransferase MtaB
VKYAILTFGCRTNQADSFDLERDLRARGGEQAPVDSADLVVVNTCAVTATAEQAARQAIRRVGRLNPRARILATGCYATRQPSDLASLPVWRVVPNDNKTEALQPGRGDPCVAPATSVRPMLRPGTRGRTLHLLRVQSGCNEACAYCIVPTTRGRSRSLPLDAVARQISEAASAGFKEVMITGVHLGSYGRDLDPPASLSDLVRVLSAHPADVRFRLSAIEPMDFGDDVIAALACTGRFACHFHLPLQHASDRILSAMVRPYTLERYAATVERLGDEFPDAAIGADLIVGFPGETADDFDACTRYLAASPLAYVHVFPFSPRPGTRAAQLGGRPRGEEVRRRVQHVRSVGADLSRRFRERFVGTVREGLTIEDGSLVLTDNYLRVRIPAGRERNERVRVRILEDGDPMNGEMPD